MLENGKTKMVQGVREVFDMFDGESDGNETSAGKVVLVGRSLQQFDFEGSFSRNVWL